MIFLKHPIPKFQHMFLFVVAIILVNTGVSKILNPTIDSGCNGSAPKNTHRNQKKKIKRDYCKVFVWI